ncbi:unnamed protein product [Victoria cruziana]
MEMEILVAAKGYIVNQIHATVLMVNLAEDVATGRSGTSSLNACCFLRERLMGRGPCVKSVWKQIIFIK